MPLVVTGPGCFDNGCIHHLPTADIPCCYSTCGSCGGMGSICNWLDSWRQQIKAYLQFYYGQYCNLIFAQRALGVSGCFGVLADAIFDGAISSFQGLLHDVHAYGSSVCCCGINYDQYENDLISAINVGNICGCLHTAGSGSSAMTVRG